MYLIETAALQVASAQEIAFGLSIILLGMFLLEYKKLSEEEIRNETIENFLNNK